MKRLILLALIVCFGQATEYRVTNLKKGGWLNVRELPLLNTRTVVGKIPYNAIGIEIRECRYDGGGREWCYISYLVGAEYLEGWVSRKFLEPMSQEEASAANIAYIKNFLKNYYLSEEKNFFDKLRLFHYFPMDQYISKKNLNHLDLRAEKVKFYKKWPVRDYKLGDIRVVDRKPEYIDVQTTVYWHYQRGDEYEKGRDTQKVRIVRHQNRLKIISLKVLRHIVYPKPIEPEEQNGTDQNDTNITTVGYYVKAGSFLENPSDKYFDKIKLLGFNYSVDQTQQGEHIFHRVFIGPFSSTVEASKALQLIRQEVNQDAFIQVNR